MSYKDARGFLKPAEREFLFNAAKEIPESGLAVNLGTEYGASTVCLLEGSHPTVSVVAVDINMSRYEGPRPSRLALVEARSVDYLQEWGGAIDLLFIDGDHSRKGVWDDIGWIDHLTVGGVVAFHDTCDYDSGDPARLHHICPEVDEVVTAWYEANADFFEELPRAWTIRAFRRTG